jgi:hypothetical protein
MVSVIIVRTSNHRRFLNMTKHIVGIILFSLIVGTSVVVAGFFNVLTTDTNSVTIKENYRVYKKKKRKKRCRKKRRPREDNFQANISQAVFDKKTNQLTTSWTFQRGSNGSRDLDLHFYVKDEFGTQYLKKETITVNADQNIYENSFDWLNRLESRNNLYIVPKISKSNDNWDYRPGINSSNSVPVLLKIDQ